MSHNVAFTTHIYYLPLTFTYPSHVSARGVTVSFVGSLQLLRYANTTHMLLRLNLQLH